MSASPSVLVLGRGVSGNAAAQLLTQEGYRVTQLDAQDGTELDAGDYAFCVTSPGIPLAHPWLVACRARGIPVRSELSLGVSAWKARGGRLVAVTGSKGKSSVVKLVAAVLKGVPCGNYGTSVCQTVLSHRDRFWAVAEVSSFQLETTDLPGDAFVAAGILNLQEDHLDRHGSVAVYHALKRKLLTMTPHPFAPEDAPALARFAPLLAGSYFDNPVLRANGLMAAALAERALLSQGLSCEESAARIREGFVHFEPLPHRFQQIGVDGDTLWIDDSKATSLAALAAGVTMARARQKREKGQKGVRLIAGGLAKGDDPVSVLPVLRDAVAKCYLIGACAEAFEKAWRTYVPCERCGTLEKAVASVCRECRAGEVVLLSPGTASFDQFEGFAARGDAFRALFVENKGNSSLA